MKLRKRPRKRGKAQGPKYPLRKARILEDS